MRHLRNDGVPELSSREAHGCGAFRSKDLPGVLQVSEVWGGGVVQEPFGESRMTFGTCVAVC